MTTTPDTHSQAADLDASGTAWTVVHRVVTPGGGDLDTLPLYIDFNPLRRTAAEDPRADLRKERGGPTDRDRAASALERSFVLDRRRVHLPPNRIASFGTYFNAFPASYWRQWTDVTTVRLSVTTTGPSRIVVYRSSARGTANRHESAVLEDSGTAVFDLPLTSFGDGGWYWFDMVSESVDTVLEDAHWSVPTPSGFRPGSVSVGITTFNRPDFCVRQITNFANSPDVLEVLDRIVIVDQGTQHVTDEPDFAQAAARVGDKLRIIEQGNLGGSGGFSRGMYEAAYVEGSSYVLLLDDDVVCETEGILRAVAFADFARTPTVVGGHMFNLYERTTLHAYGEEVQEYRFFWQPLESTGEAHDFAEHNLRGTPWLHRRADVDYNGWWMCLIPTEVVRRIGLSLPVFIKWDDAEFGLRAKAAGIPTVSMPGVAVWHVPWTDKDDTIDWQAYYHQRNRWLAALLYSPYPRGGILPRESFMVDVKHLLSLQYSAVELRLMALEDLLRGPAHLHATLGTKLGEVRMVRSSFPDARVQKDPASFPAVRRLRPPPKGRRPHAPAGRMEGLAMALSGALRQFRDVAPSAETHPEARVPAMDGRWWRLSHLDSAIVSTADGTGASWYVRDKKRFRTMLGRSLTLHRAVLSQWQTLSEEYRRELPSYTSAEEWQRTFNQNS